MRTRGHWPAASIKGRLSGHGTLRLSSVLFAFLLSQFLFLFLSLPRNIQLAIPPSELFTSEP